MPRREGNSSGEVERSDRRLHRERVETDRRDCTRSKNNFRATKLLENPTLTEIPLCELSLHSGKSRLCVPSLRTNGCAAWVCANYFSSVDRDHSHAISSLPHLSGLFSSATDSRLAPHRTFIL